VSLQHLSENGAKNSPIGVRLTHSCCFQIAAFLEPYRDTKLIHFSTMDGAFGGFEDKVSRSKEDG
jgi:hypothetical protein